MHYRRRRFQSSRSKVDVEQRVSKCVFVMGFHIQVQFCIEIFCIIWSHTDFEILAVVACAQYNHLCMHPNNSEVSRPRPNISKI